MKVATIECDECHKNEKYEILRILSNNLIEKGWLITLDLDLCKECAKKLNARIVIRDNRKIIEVD